MNGRNNGEKQNKSRRQIGKEKNFKYEEEEKQERGIIQKKKKKKKKKKKGKRGEKEMGNRQREGLK